MIKNLRKYDHISDAMKDLLWLKIPQCIQFKVLVTIYQCVNGLAPPFIINLLDLSLTRKNLRSNTQGKLPIPLCSLAQVCNGSIRYAGPQLWNELPQYIRDAKTLGLFKTHLKTHLFQQCFDWLNNILVCKLSVLNYTCKVLLIRCKSVEMCYINQIDRNIRGMQKLLDYSKSTLKHIYSNNVMTVK